MSQRRGTAEPIEDKATGKWSFVVDVGIDPATGKRRQVRRRGFPTKKAAMAELTTLRTTAANGSYVPSERVTFGGFLVDEWLPAIRTTIEPTTWESYERNVTGHVVPRLGAVKLQRLDPAQLNAFYADLLVDGRKDGKGGLSARTVRYLHTILHRALRDASKWGRVSRNVAALADPPSAKAARAPEMKFWSPEELARFLATVADDRLGPVFRVAAMTGLRRGEVLGLTWADLDLDAGTATIQRQVRAVRHVVELVEVTKSSAGRRSVDLDAGTIAMLRSVRARQLRERLALGAGYRDLGLVFTAVDGSMLDPESVSCTFTRRVDRADVPRIRFHDLRHTHAVHMIAAGAHPKVVSERLGHASSTFTLDRYGHLMPGTQAGVAASVAALVDGL